MCYKPVPAFEADDGTLFKTEPQAIVHSVMAMLGFNEASAQNVLDNASALLPHIQRTIELGSAARATHLAPAKAGKDPGKDPTPYEERSRLLGRLQAWGQKDKEAASTFIHSGGKEKSQRLDRFESLSDINNCATDAEIEQMHSDLDFLGVA